MCMFMNAKAVFDCRKKDFWVFTPAGCEDLSMCYAARGGVFLLSDSLDTNTRSPTSFQQTAHTSHLLQRRFILCLGCCDTSGEAVKHCSLLFVLVCQDLSHYSLECPHVGNGLDVHSQFLCLASFTCVCVCVCLLCVCAAESVMSVCACKDALLFVSSKLFLSGQNCKLSVLRG